MKSDSNLKIIVRFLPLIGVVIIGLYGIIGSAPTTHNYRFSPVIPSASTDMYLVRILPVSSNNCQAMTLNIENKTDKDIELDWNKTLFISNGRTSGGFMFEGVVYKDRNNPKPPDIIFPKSTFIKNVWPNNLVDYTAGRYGGWRHDCMPPGETGIYLTLRIGQDEFKERIVFQLIRENQ